MAITHSAVQDEESFAVARHRRCSGRHRLPAPQPGTPVVFSCDYLLLWSGDPWSSDNSQHLLDPYSFTHMLHGFVLYGLLALVAARLSPVWRLWLAVSIEAFWEVVENSEFVIR